ncbi:MULTISPECIES: siphovirus Gp157 family protein [Paenibacillus]|uniref:siphovirus Gp157 family protein n=1 Tax=Paenibacillus TaxID=44249 RepID=UPI000B83BEE3|nr:siphovirus Gp157 family protein [Paenibacillus amylolyticus]
MSKLYELGEKYRRFNDFVDVAWDDEDLTEDDLQMYIETLEAIEDEVSVKVENIVKFMKNIEGDIEAFKNEEKRLEKKRKYLQNKFDGLKNYMQTTLEVSNIDKVNAGTFKVKLQTNPPSINIVDPKKVPDKYKTAQDPKIDSKALLKDVKNGLKVEGAILVTDKKHIRIS